MVRAYKHDCTAPPAHIPPQSHRGHLASQLATFLGGGQMGQQPQASHAVVADHVVKEGEGEVGEAGPALGPGHHVVRVEAPLPVAAGRALLAGCRVAQPIVPPPLLAAGSGVSSDKPGSHCPGRPAGGGGVAVTKSAPKQLWAEKVGSVLKRPSDAFGGFFSRPSLPGPVWSP